MLEELPCIDIVSFTFVDASREAQILHKLLFRT